MSASRKLREEKPNLSFRDPVSSPVTLTLSLFFTCPCAASVPSILPDILDSVKLVAVSSLQNLL